MADGGQPSRFASGEHVRKELPGGDYLILKQELTYGESLTLSQAGMPREGGTLDLREYYIARALAYVVEWGGPGFKDKEGKPTREAVESLRPREGGELQRILDEHTAEVERFLAPPLAATAGEAT